MRSLVSAAYQERVALFASFFILHELLKALQSEDPFALRDAFSSRRDVNRRHFYVGLS
jgi:hypothetical protein